MNKFPSRPAYFSDHSEVQNAKSRLKLSTLLPSHKQEILLKQKRDYENRHLQTTNELNTRVTKNKEKIKKTNKAEWRDPIFLVQNSKRALEVHG